MSADAQIAAPATALQISARPLVRIWLMCMAFLVFAMVIVGGATRLTDSGLSITEWLPLLGAIPPLNEADWMVAFEKYRQIPEYQLVNKGMSLEAFKFIYWWEWAHRFLGRFIGIAFFVPFVWLLATKRVEARMVPHLVLLFILGGLQGALGWYMVSSGLVDRVDVSQYRLAAHLALAVAIFAYLLWAALCVEPRDMSWRGQGAQSAIFVSVLIYFQIIIGAFVAGLDAGQGYNTWPKMDGAFLPSGLLAMDPAWRNFFESALTVQFVHRVFAYLVVLVGGWHITRTLRTAPEGVAQLSAGLLGLVLLLQVGLGIWTLLARVPISLGLLHQGGAIVVLGVALWHLHVVARR
ncbi:MAG: heme A synthase [Alphaproteobacteria bacterium]|nr:heme A synthase [Alphaproteobacteria bacterium]